MTSEQRDVGISLVVNVNKISDHVDSVMGLLLISNVSAYGGPLAIPGAV